MNTSVKNKISFDDTSVAFSSKSDEDLKRMYLLFSSMNYGWLVDIGTGLITSGLKLGLPIKGIIRKTIFKQFCGGETIDNCRNTSLELRKYGIATVLDYSVEGEKNEEGFELAVIETLKTIEKSKVPPKNPFCVFKVTGIADFDLLEKKQSGEKLSGMEKQSFKLVKSRIERICQAAHDADVCVFIDAEESWIQDVVDDLACEMMEKFNKSRAIVYNTFQLYRADMLDNFKEATAKAEEKGYYLGAKLVRGAYMEKERDRAEEMGYEDPIQPNKEVCDSDFNEALEFAVASITRVSFCCGSHNEYSNLYLTELMQENNIEENDPRVFFAQLFGMSDNISFNLANAGYNVAKYVPYGPVKSVLPYLIRRADENTAISGQTSRELSLVKKELRHRKRN